MPKKRCLPEEIINKLREADILISQGRKALDSIRKGVEFLQDFPFTCRKATPEDPLLREMLIPFGARGYVVLFEIEDNKTVTILAVRHQREEDFH
ncbi:MAG: type II toxin-antitoxin system RelE/ParE family toxin [Deltaproteobacteria bacterium]|jgi:plasmid stabilization system protein ParE|nr:type II toxin-antitoxin system RelE/ParE family toxin [Deltaproteobacteria bacterium]